MIRPCRMQSEMGNPSLVCPLQSAARSAPRAETGAGRPTRAGSHILSQHIQQEVHQEAPY